MKRIYQILLVFILLVPIVSAQPDFMGIYRKYKDESSERLSGIASAYMKRNELDSALVLYTIMANRFDDKMTDRDKSLVCEALNCIGSISFMRGDYIDAYSKFSQSVEMVNVPLNPGSINLAAIHWLYRDKDKAYNIIESEMEKALQRKQWGYAEITLANMATIDPVRSLSRIPEKYIRLLTTFSENAEFLDSASDAVSTRKASLYSKFLSKALIESYNNNHAAAIEYYKDAIVNDDNMLIPDRDHFTALIQIGKEFDDLNCLDSALFYLDEARNLAESNDYRELKMDAYETLSDIYARTGMKDSAEIYRYRYLELTDSVFNIKQFGKIRDLQTVHEVRKFQVELDVMKAKDKMRVIVIIVVSFSSLLFLVLLLWVAIQYRKLKQKNESLFDMNMQVVKQQQEAKCEERDILSRQQPAERAETSSVEIHADDRGEEVEVLSEQAHKYASSLLDDDTKVRIESKIREVFNNVELICQEGFSLSDLAQLCCTNQKYVSQVLNETMDTTFSQLLNKRRVEIARERMIDFEHYGHLSIEGIVESVGFKSRSTFSKTFKRLTGLTPSEFQKNARRNFYGGS